MKILIFGSSSRIGKVFNKKFNKHYIINALRKVKPINSFKNKVYYNSLTEPKILTSIKKSEVIINFTGESIDTHKMFISNILFVKKLVNLINKYNTSCTFVHFSTCGIYQDLSSEINFINEKTSPIPFQRYAKTKYIGEQYVLRRCKSKNIVLRPAQILGQGMSNQSLHRLKYYLEKNLFFYINDKNSIWSFTDINDIFKILDLIIKKKIHYNGSINLASTIELFKLIKIIKNKYSISSFQPTLNLKFLNTFIKPLDFIGIKHPLDANVIKSLTSKKKYSKGKVKRLFTLSQFHNVKF